MDSKQCSECREIKPLNEFHRSSRNSSGRQARCKQCASRIQREWFRANPGYSSQRQLARNPNYYRDRNRLLRYGLTPEDVDEMRQAQDGRCAICRMEKRLVIDHCHASGRVRALLCTRCNSALAQLEDKQWLAAATQYLDTHATRPDVT